jgi:hypothetical protein
MLWLERHVVATLSATVEPARRPAIAEYVDGVLRSMPEHLRFGVAAESVVLGSGAWITGRLGSSRSLDDRIAAWEESRIGVIRQYVRLLSSLVMFADQELPRGEDAA